MINPGTVLWSKGAISTFKHVHTVEASAHYTLNCRMARQIATDDSLDNAQVPARGLGICPQEVEKLLHLFVAHAGPWFYLQARFDDRRKELLEGFGHPGSCTELRWYKNIPGLNILIHPVHSSRLDSISRDINKSIRVAYGCLCDIVNWVLKRPAWPPVPLRPNLVVQGFSVQWKEVIIGTLAASLVDLLCAKGLFQLFSLFICEEPMP